MLTICACSNCCSRSFRCYSFFLSCNHVIAYIKDSDRFSNFSDLYRWINCSQVPLIEQLQDLLYGQLTDYKEMPSSAKSPQAKAKALQRAAKNKRVLLTIDDIWVSVFVVSNFE